jgi:hypothetical protein
MRLLFFPVVMMEFSRSLMHPTPPDASEQSCSIFFTV